MKSLLYYGDSMSSGGSDIEEFDPKKDIPEYSSQMSKAGGKLSLPPPKRQEEVPIPPPPIEILHATIAKNALEAANEKSEEIEVDVETLRREGLKLAESNAVVRDKTQYNRVGYDRAKSQLTFLADLDAQTRNAFEEQIRKRTSSKIAANKMYGW
jgi:hypothetical protein